MVKIFPRLLDIFTQNETQLLHFEFVRTSRQLVQNDFLRILYKFCTSIFCYLNEIIFLIQSTKCPNDVAPNQLFNEKNLCHSIEDHNTNNDLGISEGC